MWLLEGGILEIQVLRNKAISKAFPTPPPLPHWISPDFCPPQRQDVFWQPLFVLECRPGMKTGGAPPSALSHLVGFSSDTRKQGQNQREYEAQRWEPCPRASSDATVGIPGPCCTQVPSQSRLPAASWRDSVFFLWPVKFSSLANGSGPIFWIVDCCGSLTPLKGGPKAQWRIKTPLGADV